MERVFKSIKLLPGGGARVIYKEVDGDYSVDHVVRSNYLVHPDLRSALQMLRGHVVEIVGCKQKERLNVTGLVFGESNGLEWCIITLKISTDGGSVGLSTPKIGMEENPWEFDDMRSIVAAVSSEAIEYVGGKSAQQTFDFHGQEEPEKEEKKATKV